MDKKIKLILSDCAEKAIEELTQNILDSVYDWQPKVYKRSYQLLEAISRTEVVKNVTGSYICEVYFDYKKMQPIINEGTWNNHADFWGGWITDEKSSSDLVNWLENGTNNKWYSHESYGFIRDTVEYMKNEFTNLFKSYARRNGLDLK